MISQEKVATLLSVRKWELNSEEYRQGDKK